MEWANIFLNECEHAHGSLPLYKTTTHFSVISICPFTAYLLKTPFLTSHNQVQQVRHSRFSGSTFYQTQQTFS